MADIKGAQEILKSLGLPPQQQNEISALTLLALCALKPNDTWSKAVRYRATISKTIMAFIRKEYNKDYAENTRETFRRQVLHQFVQACIAEYNPFDPGLPTNSPNTHYAISEEALKVVQSYGTKRFQIVAGQFTAKCGSLSDRYEQRRIRKRIPVIFPDGTELYLSPGKHNRLQVEVINEFASKFAPGARVLYFGDTANKNLHTDEIGLRNIGLIITEHDKLPDIVLYDKKNNWLFLIEVVTSHGPMTPKRIVELQKMLARSKAGAVFVTAFSDMSEFRKHLRNIAWETEVWIADMPDHLIHFNGDKFFGPR